jgi:hypothetical protein
MGTFMADCRAFSRGDRITYHLSVALRTTVSATGTDGRIFKESVIKIMLWSLVHNRIFKFPAVGNTNVKDES